MTTDSMIGKTAPTFSLPDQDGKLHTLRDYAGKHVVLFFYPKDDTPGCTKESCGFRDAYSDFTSVGAVVLGISILDVKSKKKFANKFALNFPLLADEDHAVAEAFGVWGEKQFMGNRFMGVKRETFIIGPDGTIIAHWPNATGSEDHAREVLAKLKELPGLPPSS